MFLAKNSGFKGILYLGNVNQKEIGDMQKIMLKCNGKYYNNKNPKTM